MSIAKMLKVMVVDDHISSRMVTVEALNAMGITSVAVANDGRDGYTKLITSPVHLLITDIFMPDINGYQLLKAVRSHPVIGKIGAIILTGKKDSEAMANARVLGVNNVLEKPFSMPGLKSAIESVVGKID